MMQMVRDHERNLARCDVCCRTFNTQDYFSRPGEIPVPSKLSAYGCNAWPDMFGIQNGYGSLGDNGTTQFYYADGNTPDATTTFFPGALADLLWRTGKQLVCDTCLQQFIDEGLLVDMSWPGQKERITTKVITRSTLTM